MNRLRTNTIVLILLLAIGLAACTRAEPQAGIEVAIAESEFEPTVGLEVGDTLEVVLAANLSTGCYWEVGFINRNLLLPVAEPELIAQSPLLPDAEAAQVFHFAAIKPGVTELKFACRQSNEPSVLLKTFAPGVAISRRRWRPFGIPIDTSKIFE